MAKRVSLKNFYVCRGMGEDDLAVLEACAERKQCGPGELIFREGEEADAMYVVELGTVEIIKADGPMTALVTIGSGGGFGEIAFFDRGKRPASARASEASHLIRIPFAALTRVLEQRPSLAAVFCHNACSFLAKRLRRILLELSFARELNERHF